MDDVHREAGGGFVLIHRRLTDHPLWTGERFTRGQAWVDLILMASYADHLAFQGNRPVSVARGQLLTSQVKLASRWRWNRKTVRSFLEALKAATMVDIQTSKETDTGYTLITLRNFNHYQAQSRKALDIGSASGTDIEAAFERTSSGHRVPTINKGNKGNNTADAPSASASRASKGDGNGRTSRTRKTHPDTDNLLAEFEAMFQGKWGTLYLPSHARDRRILHDLLTAVGADEVRARLRAFMEHGTKRTRDLGDYSVPAFRAAWNELGVLKARGEL